MIKIFVGGPSADRDRCRDVITQLRLAGADITHDWVAQMDSFVARGITDADLKFEDAMQIADDCERGVREADVVLWLSSDSLGASHEAGMARALGKTLIVSGPRPHPIYGRTSVYFSEDAAAVAVLARQLRWRGR